MKINKFNYQIELLEKIKAKIQHAFSYADEISDLLQISKDAVYRRMRGETALSLDEAAILIAHYQIENPFQINNSMVNFHFTTYTSESNEIVRYLNKLSADLDAIGLDKSTELIFCAEDIPLFHYFEFPLLGAFKLFYWQKSILYTEEFQQKSFSENIINEEIINISKELSEKYKRIPSLEIWTENTVNSFLKQIEFYNDAGYIDSEKTTYAICTEVKKMVEKIERQTIHGYKKNNDSSDQFQLYVSDVSIGNNCVLAKLENVNFLYLSFNTFNILKCVEPVFIHENEKWIKRIMDNSTPLSKCSQKIRNKFFMNIYKRIDEFMERLG